MSAHHWIIGTALVLAACGVSAGELGTQDLDASAPVSTEPRHADSGGDLLGATRNNPQDTSREDTGSSRDGTGGDLAPTPAGAQRAHLGWQSLLPGSIQ